MTTSKEMMQSNKALWIKFSELADIVLTNDAGNSHGLDRGQREFLFAYISNKNKCDYCSIRHFEFARSLGVTELPHQVIEMVDMLYSNIGSPITCKVTPLVEQIIATIGLAQFINLHMLAYNVPRGPIALLDTPYFKESGYAKAFNNLLTG